MLPLQRCGGWIVDVCPDRTVPDMLNGLVDHAQRDEKPFAWHNEIPEPVLDLDNEASRLKDAVNEVFELCPVDVV